jgi:Tol biopolymer transport system component
VSQTFGQFPTWSPDGTYILFAPLLNVVPATGGPEVRLSVSGLGSEAEFPDWPALG